MDIASAPFPMVTRATPQLATAIALCVGAALLALPSPAFAHIAGQPASGFASGFKHPLFGFDHLLAMLAVGIWGAQIGGRSIWVLPVLFPLVMAIGGVIGISGIELPQPETFVAGSVLVLGAAILAAWKAPEIVSGLLIAVFAIFHGYAHGIELPKAQDPVTFGLGFVIATGMIHLVGIGFGLLFSRPFKGWIARGAGALIASAGIYFLAA